MAKPPKKPKPEEIETDPGAQERFERAVDRAVPSVLASYLDVSARFIGHEIALAVNLSDQDTKVKPLSVHSGATMRPWHHSLEQRGAEVLSLELRPPASS